MTIKNLVTAILADLFRCRPRAKLRGRMHFDSPLRDEPRPLFVALHSALGDETCLARQPIRYNVTGCIAHSSAVTFPPPSKNVAIERVYIYDAIVGGEPVLIFNFNDRALAGDRYHIPEGRLSITAS